MAIRPYSEQLHELRELAADHEVCKLGLVLAFEQLDDLSRDALLAILREAAELARAGARHAYTEAWAESDRQGLTPQ